MNILHALSPLVAARNPSWLEVNCPNSITSPATVGTTDLAFILEPAAGQRITITLPNGNTVQLEAVAGAPDSSATQYQIGSISGETIANLVATCNVNLQLMEFYQVQDLGGAARFIARQPGNNAPVIIFDDPAWGFATPTVGASAAVVPPGYQAGLRLWVETEWGSGTYTLVRDLVYSLDKDRNFREDIATLLLPYVGYTWLPYNNDEVHRTTSLQRRFHVELWEAWGDPVRPRAISSAPKDIKAAWYAGTRNTQQYLYWNRYVDWLTFTAVNSAALSPWLTYRGSDGARHEVSAAQQHHLAWYQRVANGELVLQVVVYYRDGTNDSTSFTDDNVQQGEIGHWPTGFDTLELGLLQPTKEPYRYTVQLFRGATAVSTLHTFHLVDRDANELHIEFISSLGAQESMRCVGAWENNATASHREVRKVLAPQQGAAPASHRSAGESLLEGVQHTLVADTGWLDAGERDALLDIVHSPAIRLVYHRDGRYQPLRLVGSEQLAGHHGTPTEHLHRLQFRFVLADPDMAHSVLPLYPLFTLPGEPGEEDE